MIARIFKYVFFISLLLCFILMRDYKFFGWLNVLPIVLLFAGILFGGPAPTLMNSTQFSIYRYIICHLVAPIFLLCLVLDRACDYHQPLVRPARFLSYNRANFLASSSVSISIISSDGAEIDFPVSASAFSRMPVEGKMGRAIIGRGFFGINYIQRVEFDGYTQ